MRVTYDSSVTPETLSNMIVSGSGATFVNKLWDDFRWRYSFIYELESLEEYIELRNFKILRDGRAHTFRVYDESFHDILEDEQGDWQDSSDDYEEFQLSASTFQIYYHLTDTVTSKSHKLTKIISTETITIEVYHNSAWVEKTEDTDYTIDCDTGIVTWLTGKAPSDGETVRVSCSFHRHCRFTTDEIPATFASYQRYDFGDLEIEEVIE